MISFGQDEKIIAIHRRHPITLFFAAVPLFIFFSIIIAGVIFGISRVSAESDVLSPLILFLVAIFFHLFWIALFMMLADYLLSAFIITDQRIIMVAQKGLFAKTVSECALSKIQDTSVTIPGFLPTLLKYGGLAVRTATEQEDFIFNQLADPTAAADEIAEATKEFSKNEEQFKTI